MFLTEEVMKNYQVAKLFRQNTDRVNSLDFSADGLNMITCSDDDQIFLYDCQEGVNTKTVNSKKYGVDLVKFTHSPNTCIHASTKVDDTIRYLSLHDNKFIRYFSGHTRKVSSLSLSPIEDTFISASLDRTVRLWDLRSPSCQGVVHISTPRPIATYDPEGVIFAVGYNSETIKLYDVRSFDKGPFATFKFAKEKECDWTGIKFSPDGKIVMISTNGAIIRLFDSFNGKALQTLTGHLNNKGIPIEASFSPDTSFILGGSTDGTIHCWNVENGYKICVLKGDHPSPVQVLQFNPKFQMFASACTNLALWISTVESE